MEDISIANYIAIPKPQQKYQCKSYESTVKRLQRHPNSSYIYGNQREIDTAAEQLHQPWASGPFSAEGTRTIVQSLTDLQANAIID